MQALARAARALMLDLLPKVTEMVDPKGPYIQYGYARDYKDIVGYITVNQKGVKLGVARGATLPDPKKLLKGTGKANRHVVISTPADLRTPGLRQLVRAAVGRVEEGPRLNACARPFSQLSRWLPLREILSSVAWHSATRRSTRPRSPRSGCSPEPVAWGSSQQRHGAVMRGGRAPGCPRRFSSCMPSRSRTPTDC